MLVMKGQHTEFNRLLGLGMNCFSKRQGTGECAVTAATGHSDDKQQSALTKTERELALSRLKGGRKERVGWGMRRMTSVLW